MAFSKGIDTRPGSVRIIRTLHIDPPGIDRCRLRSWITIFATCLFALLNQRLVQLGEFIDRIRSADRFILSRSKPWKAFFQQSQNPFNECLRTLFFGSHSKLLWRGDSSLNRTSRCVCDLLQISRQTPRWEVAETSSGTRRIICTTRVMSPRREGGGTSQLLGHQAAGCPASPSSSEPR